MNRKNAKRNALVTSILSLLLCVSMLVSTTFAWFTDEVVSGRNTIAAGNLDIALMNGDDEVQNGDVLFDEDVNGDKIKLWEPGMVVYENLQIVNKGSLELKYQMFLNFGSENAMTEGGYKLSDVLQVALIDEVAPGTSRDVVLAAAEASAKKGALSDFYLTGELAANTPGAEQAVVIFWAPNSAEIDNRYNANNGKTTTDGKPLHIEFGVTLLATQKMAENDSFGNDYDENAWNNAMKVSTASELATAIENVEDGGMIALLDDITFDADSRTSSGGTWYEGLYYVGDKSFTLDLGGKTVTADSSVNDYLMLFKNDGDKANTITIKNGTLEAASTAYSALCTSTTSTQKITINLENVDLIGNNPNGAVAKIRGGAELNVKAGTVINGKNNYVGIECVAATVNIYDGAEIYQKGTSSYAGSLAGTSNNGTINVYGGYGVSAKGGFIAMNSGGTINVSGGEWIANTDGTYANDNNSVLIAQSDKRASSVINVTGGTFKGGYNCYGNVAGDAQINITSGLFNADPASYVEDGYSAVKSGDVYMVLPADNAQTIADGLYYNGTDTYYVTNANGLSAVAAEVNKVDEYVANIFDGKTVMLMGDIDLGGAEWAPIGNYGNTSKQFTGVFDGQGYTISNFKITEKTPDRPGKDRSPHGFFGNLNGTVKNLTLENGTLDIQNAKWAGVLVGRMNGGSIENCNVVDSSITIYHWQVGGLLGQLNNGKISNCTVTNTTVNGYAAVGGLVGVALLEGERTIENCVVENCQIVQNGSFGGDYDTMFGTMVGALYSGKLTVNLNDCAAKNNNIDTLCGYIEEGDVLNVNGAQLVNNVAELQAALNAATADITVAFGADITGDITVPKKTGVDITIDGKGNTFTGMITVIGGDDSGLTTIKNIDFVAAAGAGSVIVAPGKYINSDNGIEYNNYIYGLTVENCTFTDPSGAKTCAAVRAEKGGHYNWTLKNLTVDSTMHSLYQGGNVANSFVIDGCEVSSKNGVNLVYSNALEMTDCTFDVTGYAIRIGVNGHTMVGNYTIDGCNLKSANDDGDAVIIFRGTMTGSTMTITDTTLTGTPDITNPAGVTVVK